MILVTKSLRSCTVTKILPWETRIGIQIKILKVVAILLRGLDALLVGSNIWVDVFPEWIVVFHVLIRAT